MPLPLMVRVGTQGGGRRKYEEPRRRPRRQSGLPYQGPRDFVPLHRESPYQGSPYGGSPYERYSLESPLVRNPGKRTMNNLMRDYAKTPIEQRWAEPMGPREANEYRENHQYPKGDYQRVYASPVYASPVYPKARSRARTPPRAPKRYEEPPRKTPSPPKGGMAAYKEIKALGAGGQGECSLVERRSDGRRFVRKISHTFSMSKSKPVEVLILKDLLGHHKRSIRLIEYALTNKDLVTIYEFYAGGDLISCLPKRGEKQSESFVWWIFLQLADVLAYLHSGYDYMDPDKKAHDWQPVIHCDIKLDNVFLRQRRVDKSLPDIVLGDFGLATLKPGKHAGGTDAYLSPEWDRTGNTTSSDVWALGATIHELIHGYPPQYKQPEPLSFSFSSILNRIIMSCLRKDPGARPSSRSLIKDILKNYKLWSGVLEAESRRRY